MADQITNSTEETAAHDLLRAAQAFLAQTAKKDGVPADFAERLFGHVIFEDLAPFAPADIADLSREAWSFLRVRKGGVPKIRLEDAPAGVAGAAGPLASVSVLEVINDDMPFLVDSVMAELARQGAMVRLVAHPVLALERGGDNEISAYGLAVSPTAKRESFIHIHIDRIDNPVRRTEIVQGLEQVLADVRLAVADWRPMMTRVGEVLADMKVNPPPLPVDEVAEAVQFLEWLVGNNFTFLGVRDYVFTDTDDTLKPDYDTGLGLLRNRDVEVLRRGDDYVTITPELRKFFRAPTPLIVTKSAARSRVHRHTYMDYIGVKRFDERGMLVGEFRIVGLFTSTAYTSSTASIPYVRRKVAHVVGRAGFDPNGHLGKALASVLENYPRDELFQIDEDTLYRFAIAVLQLDGRPRVRVLARRDEFDRFVSVLVFVPRDRYDSDVRIAIGDYLAGAYKGHVSAYYPHFPEGPNVRVHFIIGRRGGVTPDPDRTALERDIEGIVRSWSDAFSEALHRNFEPARARELQARYGEAFSASYRGAYAPETAVNDLRAMESLSAEMPRGADFQELAEGCIGLKIWSYNRPIALTDRVPVLENMGFRVVDERTYEIAAARDGVAIWFHDMVLERAENGAASLGELKSPLEATFLAVMGGVAENDGYNALVLGAGLGWRDVALLRAVSRYLRQVLVPFSQDYMWATLRRHPAMARQIVELFYARFDPRETKGREKREAEILAAIEKALEGVDSLDEDRILRRFVNAVQSGLRTNYFQLKRNGKPADVITIKYDSRKVDGLPAPRPLYEMFVYSPRVEGVHLRFGKVARGGLRWSDRPQDFRTEVLGLVKAQQVKNAVIVPVGAKGGFVPKWLPKTGTKGGTREAIQEEGIAAYKLFVSSMLDITDNVTTEGIAHPRDVVRHDSDDPYLVVAADKGTATFSDIANGVSRDHGFWLDDAFASGGSAGYDHKKMGITARGAWESVKRHFREMDIDIGRTPFSVVGVGDMSGDVFGNGLLREKTTRLIAAFDHRDIFIDPDPDPLAGFAERQRLFNLPRSSWQDYNKGLISKGGGVYPRNLKQIELSNEARKALGIEAVLLTPQDLMRAILKAPVDLLFFGGIGTYVRASSESDLAAGDRANDAIRIAGSDLRVKVVGEGANLGMTQLGRIEAARTGVRLNTDAIDNSAGVNTSDVEVNIKIALAEPVRSGRLTLPARDELLTSMTDDVAALVLRTNYQQTLALSLAQRRGMEDFGFQQRLMQSLEQRGLLDRVVEFLPDDMTLGERRKRAEALTRPELSVLLAYAKLTLYSDLLDSPVPDDPYLGREIGRYFPAALAERFPEALQNHRLRREIIATQLANSIINRGGPSLIVRIADQTGASSTSIAQAFAAVRDSYAMTAFNTDIDALDAKVAGDVQLDLYRAVQDLLLDRLVWFLRNVDLTQGLAGIVEHYRDGIAAVDAALGKVLSKEMSEARDARQRELLAARVPEELAWRVANLPVLTSAPDIVLVAARAKKPVADVAATYFAVNAHFRIAPVIAAARAIPVADYFDRLALDRALDSIGDAERKITASIVAGGASGPAAVEAWAKANAAKVDRIRDGIHQIAATGLTLSKLTVAASLLGDLAGA